MLYLGGEPVDADQIVEQATAKVGEAVALEGALARLADLLAQRYRLTRISVSTVVPGEMVELVGAWTPGGTILRPGSRMAIDRTETVRGDFDRFARGEMVVGVPERVDVARGVSDVMHEEGMETILTIPLRTGDGLVGIISFASASPEAYGAADRALFERLGAGLQAHLIELIRKHRA